ncbi:MAG: PQQ-binding-like beta-propeller repeat protein [Planctomycetes bacterium]|nr:PQQ-binding-like beta-propeller repeat protein [Planctomycetota bacterium]
MNRAILVAIAWLLLVVEVRAADWAMYRADAARSGYTPEQVPAGLVLQWTHASPHAPRSAWPTRTRQQFDRAYQPVIAGGVLYYGSSADGKVYALDAATGQPRWTFFTDSPVRFAPVVWRERLFVASDDGHLYCLAATDGQLLWKVRGGPKPDMLLGNDRMISRWPARGGPVVAGDVLYFGAGIWPTEGIFIYALDPTSGKVLWCNDSSGGLEMDQPHPTARARSGISAQGYLAACGDALLVPTGRAVPAVLDRVGGQLRYFQLQQNTQVGGAEVAAVDEYFFNGGEMFALGSGARLNRIGVQITAHPDFVIASRENKIIAFDRRKLLVDKETPDGKGGKRTTKALGPPVWSVDLPPGALAPDTTPPGAELPGGKLMGSTAWSRPALSDAAGALIVAGDQIVAAGRSQVLLLDGHSRKIVWEAEVDGAVYGLAVAEGRLYASTDRGKIYCFGNGTGRPEVREVRSTPPQAAENAIYARAAQEIIERTGVTEGYCLDLACGDGLLALELARRTKLHIYCVEKDPAKVKAARQLFDAAGLYGVRVTIHQADPARVPYPNYFADLVVSGRSVTEGSDAIPIEQVRRVQCPGSGIACVGAPGAMQQSTRRPLDGAGSWTHQNAIRTPTPPTRSAPAIPGCVDPCRCCGSATRIWSCPAVTRGDPRPWSTGGICWPRESTPCEPRTSTTDERCGSCRCRGSTVWELPLPGILLSNHRGESSIGAAWTGGNVCTGNDRAYVHTPDACLCLDLRTGRKTAELRPPLLPNGKPGKWGYLAYQDGTLFGSLVDEQYLVKGWAAKWDTSEQFTESVLFFALDARDGTVKWTFAPQQSIRHNAIAVGRGCVYLIDRPHASGDEAFDLEGGRKEAKQRTAAGGQSEHQELRQLREHPTGRLLALDAETGKVLWTNDEEIFGTMLAFSTECNVLLMSYQPVHQASRLSEWGDRMAGLRPSDGARLWDVGTIYASRPILNGRTIYAQSGAWDLWSGKKLPFTFTRSYGCGIPVGSKHLLVFRSATLGYRDLTGGTGGTENYGGIRPGCWINAIPAGGLVLMADAASWCTCSYLNQATCALQPAE